MLPTVKDKATPQTGGTTNRVNAKAASRLKPGISKSAPPKVYPGAPGIYRNTKMRNKPNSRMPGVPPPHIFAKRIQFSVLPTSRQLGPQPKLCETNPIYRTAGVSPASPPPNFTKRTQFHPRGTPNTQNELNLPHRHHHHDPKCETNPISLPDYTKQTQSPRTAGVSPASPPIVQNEPNLPHRHHHHDPKCETNPICPHDHPAPHQKCETNPIPALAVIPSGGLRSEAQRAKAEGSAKSASPKAIPHKETSPAPRFCETNPICHPGTKSTNYEPPTTNYLCETNPILTNHNNLHSHKPLHDQEIRENQPAEMLRKQPQTRTRQDVSVIPNVNPDTSSTRDAEKIKRPLTGGRRVLIMPGLQGGPRSCFYNSGRDSWLM